MTLLCHTNSRGPEGRAGRLAATALRAYVTEMGMKHLYLNHEIIANEDNWSDIQKLVTGAAPYRLTVSTFNLYEIARDGDKARGKKRAAFIDSLGPAWCYDRLDRQAQELNHYLATNFWKLSPGPVLAFADDLADLYAFRVGRSILNPHSAREWIATTDVLRHEAARKLSPNALRDLQAAKRRRTKALEQEVMRQWLGSKLPKQTPAGLQLPPAHQKKMLEFCIENLKDLLAACPSIAVENELYFIRSRDPNRKPKESDGPDLQHTVTGLVYGDVFVCTDGYARDCAQHAVKNLAPLPLATICDNLASVPTS